MADTQSSLGDATSTSDTINGWDRNAIIRAITGRSTGSDTTPPTVNAQTLADAGNTLNKLQQLYDGINNGFVTAAESLAGPNGPWQGDDANAFYHAMTSLTKSISGQADSLTGMPQQLVDSANYLAEAQQYVEYVDEQGSQLAQKMGASVVNGLTLTHEIPAIANAMDTALRDVAQKLNSRYVDTNHALVPPDTGASFTSSNGVNGALPNNDLPGLNDALNSLKNGPGSNFPNPSLDSLNGKNLLGPGGLPTPQPSPLLGPSPGGAAALANIPPFQAPAGGTGAGVPGGSASIPNIPSFHGTPGAAGNTAGIPTPNIAPFNGSTASTHAPSFQPASLRDLGLNPKTGLQGGLATPTLDPNVATPDFGHFAPFTGGGGGAAGGGVGAGGLGGFAPLGGLSAPGGSGDGVGRLTGIGVGASGVTGSGDTPGSSGAGGSSVTGGALTGDGQPNLGGAAGAAGAARSAGGGMPMYPMGGGQGQQQQQQGATTWLTVDWADYVGNDGAELSGDAFGR